MSVGLISAESLGAFYNPGSQTLTLSAIGKVRPGTSSIRFIRQAWVGGLKYDLVGRFTVVMGPEVPYERIQNDHVSMFRFPKDVLISTSDNPNGVPVPIRWGGFNPPHTSAELKALETQDAPEGPSSADGSGPTTVLENPNQHQIITIPHYPFTIKQASTVPTGGSVKMHYDKERLDLISTHIEGPDIVWTFAAKELGGTQVDVIVSGGIANYVYRITYDIAVIVGP